MNTSDIFNLIHNSIEANQLGKRISHKEMAKRLDISMRTYQEWRLGNSSPLAVKAIFKMLSFLSDEDILHIIKRIKKAQGQST